MNTGRINGSLETDTHTAHNVNSSAYIEPFYDSAHANISNDVFKFYHALGENSELVFANEAELNLSVTDIPQISYIPTIIDAKTALKCALLFQHFLLLKIKDTITASRTGIPIMGAIYVTIVCACGIFTEGTIVFNSIRGESFMYCSLCMMLSRILTYEDYSDMMQEPLEIRDL